MVPAYHCTLDTGIPDGHDDPQNFDLALWAKKIGELVNSLNTSSKSPK